MSYEKQTWATGQVITAEKLNHIESGIEAVEAEIPTDAYVKPSGGIPATDLASAVQTSLGKANGAIPAPSSPASGDVLKYNGSAWIADESDGLSSGIKQALLDCFAHVAWTDEHGQDYYDALEAALYPPADLVSISAVYTQSGTVYDTDTLDSLKPDLVVTATYDDSTTETVTTYTLSGTLAVGTSTITVSYGGKTTSFNVTVSDSWLYKWTPADGTLDSKGFTFTAGNGSISYGTNGATIVGYNQTATAPQIVNPIDKTHTYVNIRFTINFTTFSADNNGGFNALTNSNGTGYCCFRIGTMKDTGQSTYAVIWYTNGTWVKMTSPQLSANTDYEVDIVYDYTSSKYTVKLDGSTIIDTTIGTQTRTDGNYFMCLAGTYILKDLRVRGS